MDIALITAFGSSFERPHERSMELQVTRDALERVSHTLQQRSLCPHQADCLTSISCQRRSTSSARGCRSPSPWCFWQTFLPVRTSRAQAHLHPLRLRRRLKFTRGCWSHEASRANCKRQALHTARCPWRFASACRLELKFLNKESRWMGATRMFSPKGVRPAS